MWSACTPGHIPTSARMSYHPLSHGCLAWLQCLLRCLLLLLELLEEHLLLQEEVLLLLQGH